MSAPTPHSFIPAEALARRARLRVALQVMEGKGPSLEPLPMQFLRSCLSDESTPDPDSLIVALAEGHLEEEASEWLRASRREARSQALVEAITSRLAPLAAKARVRREHLWQLDTRRQLVRFGYAKEGEATGFDDGDIHAIFLQAFRLEGLMVALDLAKRPRPLLGSGLPLPAGVGGLLESMDVVFKQEPAEASAALMTRLNGRLCDGLSIHHWEVLPDYASQVADLALLSHWQWEVPPGQKEPVRNKVAAFLEAEHWPWDRGTSKTEAHLDLRRLIPDLRWEEGALCFTSAMGSFQAINPLKMLGAFLELDPAGLLGLVRTHVDFKPDARLSQAERFEPKLKNMYEDAVLLGGASNIVIVDEDDDEPLLLG